VSPKPNARIAVDIGGSFTDIALDYRSSLFTAKTLTTQQDPVRDYAVVLKRDGSVDKQATRQERKP
jgi:N-methylhydantoinase A/oxoprolinase/acetone carboxylase beta subunit